VEGGKEGKGERVFFGFFLYIFPCYKNSPKTASKPKEEGGGEGKGKNKRTTPLARRTLGGLGDRGLFSPRSRSLHDMEKIWKKEKERGNGGKGQKKDREARAQMAGHLLFNPCHYCRRPPLKPKKGRGRGKKKKKKGKGFHGRGHSAYGRRKRRKKRLTKGRPRAVPDPPVVS